MTSWTGSRIETMRVIREKSSRVNEASSAKQLVVVALVLAYDKKRHGSLEYILIYSMLNQNEFERRRQVYLEHQAISDTPK